MGVAWPNSSLLAKLEAYQTRCLRRILGIRSTWGSKQIGEQPIRNVEVIDRAGLPRVSDVVRTLQLTYLGHLLRRPLNDPIRNIVFDRFLAVRRLGGPRRPGTPRELWADRVLPLALLTFSPMEEFEVVFEQERREANTLAIFAQDRALWNRLSKRLSLKQLCSEGPRARLPCFQPWYREAMTQLREQL
eukprot:5461287-Alexandrium_andersonii.AAC.1